MNANTKRAGPIPATGPTTQRAFSLVDRYALEELDTADLRGITSYSFEPLTLVGHRYRASLRIRQLMLVKPGAVFRKEHAGVSIGVSDLRLVHADPFVELIQQTHFTKRLLTARLPHAWLQKMKCAICRLSKDCLTGLREVYGHRDRGKALDRLEELVS